MMDIYARLIEDHEAQRELAKKLVNTSGDSNERQALFEEFNAEVEAHAAAEEQTFYAALIEAPDGQDKARHSIAEHKTAADLLEELRELDTGSGGWIQKFKKLKEELEHHLDEEEDEVFVLAKDLISSYDANALADRFEQRKSAELR